LTIYELNLTLTDGTTRGICFVTVRTKSRLTGIQNRDCPGKRSDDHEFWELYFYRCDAAGIKQEWIIEEERSRASRQQLLSNVTSFMGGAAKAVTEGVANAFTEDDVGGHTAKNAMVSGLGRIFGVENCCQF
jgi:hypothetical protein